MCVREKLRGKTFRLQTQFVVKRDVKKGRYNIKTVVKRIFAYRAIRIICVKQLLSKQYFGVLLV